MRCQCGHLLEDHVVRASGKTKCHGGPAMCDCVYFERRPNGSGPLRYKDGHIIDRKGRKLRLDEPYGQRLTMAEECRLMNEMTMAWAREKYQAAYDEALKGYAA